MCNVTTDSHTMQSFFFAKVQVYERELPTVVIHDLFMIRSENYTAQIILSHKDR